MNLNGINLSVAYPTNHWHVLFGALASAFASWLMLSLYVVIASWLSVSLPALGALIAFTSYYAMSLALIRCNYQQ